MATRKAKPKSKSSKVSGPAGPPSRQGSRAKTSGPTKAVASKAKEASGQLFQTGDRARPATPT